MRYLMALVVWTVLAALAAPVCAAPPGAQPKLPEPPTSKKTDGADDAAEEDKAQVSPAMLRQFYQDYFPERFDNSYQSHFPWLDGWKQAKEQGTLYSDRPKITVWLPSLRPASRAALRGEGPSTRTSTSRPLNSPLRRAEISPCNARRSFFLKRLTSHATSSGHCVAFVPGRGEYLKT